MVVEKRRLWKKYEIFLKLPIPASRGSHHALMSERPRRTTRAPAKTPLELTTPSKRVKRKAAEVVDPAESLRVLLQSPKSLLTTTNISVCVLYHF